MKQTTACFTGHRPQNLSFGFDEAHADCVRLKTEIKLAIETAIQNGYDTFISGMALGVDIWCAEEVLRQKQGGKAIELVAVVPHKGQEKGWSFDYKNRHRKILEQCKKVEVLNPYYVPGCLGQRNRYLVDNSSLLIAVLGKSSGGAKNTVDYALSRKIDVVLITP